MDRGFSTLVNFLYLVDRWTDFFNTRLFFYIWWTGGQRFFNTIQFLISGGLVDRGFSTLVFFWGTGGQRFFNTSFFLVDWWTEVFQH